MDVLKINEDDDDMEINFHNSSLYWIRLPAEMLHFHLVVREQHHKSMAGPRFQKGLKTTALELYMSFNHEEQ